MGVWNFCGTDDEKGTKMSSNSEKEKMESYFYKIKSKRPEITALAWMADSHYNNIIIKIEGTGVKIVLDSIESSIWKLIFEGFITAEQLINFADENGFDMEKTVRILYNMEKEKIISLRSNSIWNEEV
ncbi:hypothetical protein [Methanosarcina mazei]|nr:hypothetical protein [Methanosarcina mazei]NLO30960.1 hypothetical protein [Methanosarcina mazei]